MRGAGAGVAEWDRRYGGDAPVWGAEPNLWGELELNGLPPGRALDLGAGEGRHALWLAARGWRVDAVDFSAVGLERGRVVLARAPEPPSAEKAPEGWR